MAKNDRTLFIDIIETISQSIIDDFSAQIEDCRERGMTVDQFTAEMHVIANDTVQTMVEALADSYQKLHPDLFIKRYHGAWKWERVKRRHHGARPPQPIDPQLMAWVMDMLAVSQWLMIDVEALDIE